MMNMISQLFWNDLAAEATASVCLTPDDEKGICVQNNSLRFTADFCEPCRTARQRIYMAVPMFSTGDAAKTLIFWLGDDDCVDNLTLWEKKVRAAKRSLNV